MEESILRQVIIQMTLSPSKFISFMGEALIPCAFLHPVIFEWHGKAGLKTEDNPQHQQFLLMTAHTDLLLLLL